SGGAPGPATPPASAWPCCCTRSRSRTPGAARSRRAACRSSTCRWPARWSRRMPGTCPPPAPAGTTCSTGPGPPGTVVPPAACWSSTDRRSRRTRGWRPSPPGRSQRPRTCSPTAAAGDRPRSDPPRCGDCRAVPCWPPRPARTDPWRRAPCERHRRREGPLLADVSGTDALLALVALVAGTVDAIGGGGGLLTVPALLAAGLPPHLALATNKGQSVFGSAAALVRFSRAGMVPLRRAGWTFPLAFIGSLGGAQLLLWVRPEVLRSLVLVLLLAAALRV